jgi:uncharacterized membrane protein YebE (DUF533 family)
MFRMTVVTKVERESIGKIVLLAAYVDGKISVSEREAFRQMTEGWPSDERRSVVRSVITDSVNLEKAANTLHTRAAKRLAYAATFQMCKADGHVSAYESIYLRRLAQLLNTQ